MFTTLYCLNLQISKIEKSATSIVFQSTMNNINLLLKLVMLLTVSNLFALEDVQSCQHCQLCVLLENSNIIHRLYFTGNLLTDFTDKDIVLELVNLEYLHLRDNMISNLEPIFKLRSITPRPGLTIALSSNRDFS